MTSRFDEAAPPTARLLTFSSGGWVILLALILVVTVIVWQVAVLSSGGTSHAIGDGRSVATYGFDLSTCLVPRDEIVASGMTKDGLRALVDPPVLSVAEVDILNGKLRRAHQGKYLVPADRVIGVRLNGQARAYPVRVLNWHEIVNDTLGGVPIAVTYNPLCDSVVVFDRRVGGETHTFAVSGLLYNSNLLMYERRPGGRGESLWSQLKCQAIAGPAAAAGHRLAVLHASLIRWDDWAARHSDGTVLAPNPDLIERYRREPYANYFGSDQLRFPVSPKPAAGDLPNKTPILILRAGSSQTVYSLTEIAGRAGADGTWRTQLGGTELLFTCRADPLTVSVDSLLPAPSLETIYCFYFAWHAMYPEVPLPIAAP